MGRGAVANGSIPPTSGQAGQPRLAPGAAHESVLSPATESPQAPSWPPATAERPPWTPPHGRELLAGITVAAVLFTVLVVFTHDVPSAPRSAAVAPFTALKPAAPPGAASAPPEWADVPLTETVADLGPVLARAVDAKLAVARSRIARCLVAAEGSRATDRAPAEVVLRLVPRSNALNVEGVEPASGASPQLLRCARRVLDGDAIPARPLVPGRRFRVAVAVE